MSTNLYIGNLCYQVTEDDLQELFGEFGEIESIKVIRDRETERSKGFGFIEMKNEEDAEASIEELNGIAYKDRNLVVNKARPRKPRQNRRY